MRKQRVGGKIVPGSFSRDLSSRRTLEIELPEFLICALQARLNDVNSEAAPQETCSLQNLIETELVSLVSIRDIAELEQRMPGFGKAVQQWYLRSTGRRGLTTS